VQGIGIKTRKKIECVPLIKNMNELQKSQQKMYAYRNENSYYTRSCDKCAKTIISIFPQDSGQVAYCQDCWWADDFDPLVYGQDFDFNRPFFEQYAELLAKTPLISMVVGDSENSDYTNYAMWNKNCYMVSSSDYNEDCLYSTYIFRSRDCADCTFTSDCELCYENVDTKKCYGSSFLQECSACTNTHFSYGCRSCQNCIGCVNLRNKEYHLFNKPCSKEEFEEAKKRIFANYKNLLDFKKEFHKFRLQFAHKFANLENCENSTGDHIVGCKNCENCFDLVDSQDCKDVILGINAKDCTDSIGVPDAELCHKVVGCPGNYAVKYSMLIWPKSSYLEYCTFTRASHNCFGCVSLNKNQYCILNKQYTQEQYEQLLPRIIEHMKKTGEYDQFFPIEVSPFAYNETAAQEYFPLTKEQALEHGYKWADEPTSKAQSENAQTCTACQNQFRTISHEQGLYKKLGVPTPTCCPKCRHESRLRQRNPRQTWQRNCSKCSNEIQSSFHPNSEEQTLCEECYLGEVV